MKLSVCLLSIALAGAALPASAQSPVTLTIDPNARLTPVSPTLYGLMTEEINYSYDGGLYAEMLRNRYFQHSWDGFEDWFVSQQGTGRAKIEESDSGPSSALPHSLRLIVSSASPENEAGLVNAGYWGIAVRPSTTYHGSFYARLDGITEAHMRLIRNQDGVTLAETHIPLDGGRQWKQYNYEMTSKSGIPAGSGNHFVLSFDQPGTVELQLVSLFPPTFHQRPNGNRADLMEMMAAMKPSFLRLPGGNYLEGDHIRDHFAWKNTIGPLVDRPTHNGTWSYHSSDGLGLLEFLEWCEDLRIEPVLAVYAGYSLSGEHVTGEALEPFVQEALDEIEYVSGDASTKWGAVRAQNGHPAPFPLHYVEIGNEDFNDRSKSYDERFERFAKAIRARYPKLQLIATIPVHSTTPDLIDDHYYQTPEEFFSMVHHYDKADRKGPKIFVGEWATRMGSPTPNFAAALGDAAWMTSMERNSDLIVMSCYAPLLVNVNPGGMQWSSDLIGYDAMRAYGSPSYWAQVLFAHHLGNFVVKSSVDQEDSLFFSSSTVSADGKTLYLKLVNASEKPRELTLHIAGAARGSATLNTLHAATRWATNTIDDPDAIHPIPGKVELPGSVWKHTLAGNSIEVLDIPLQ
jgi:alpha-N-arabinofuranosidase